MLISIQVDPKIQREESRSWQERESWWYQFRWMRRPNLEEVEEDEKRSRGDIGSGGFDEWKCGNLHTSNTDVYFVIVIALIGRTPFELTNYPPRTNYIDLRGCKNRARVKLTRKIIVKL